MYIFILGREPGPAIRMFSANYFQYNFLITDTLNHSKLVMSTPNSGPNVLEEWSVMLIVCYVRDRLYPWRVIYFWRVVFFVSTFTHSLSHSKQFRDLYLDRSYVIRTVTLKNNISNILYCCRTFPKTAHTNHQMMWCTRRIYSLLKMLYLNYWNVFTQYYFVRLVPLITLKLQSYPQVIIFVSR